MSRLTTQRNPRCRETQILRSACLAGRGQAACEFDPLSRGSASKIAPRLLAVAGCPLRVEAGGQGDAACGDDCVDQARALRQWQDDQGDCAGPQGLAEHCPQGAAVGRDMIRVRAGGAAAAKAWGMDERNRAIIVGQRDKGGLHPSSETR